MAASVVSASVVRTSVVRPAKLRLTRRGRLVFIGIPVLLILAVMMLMIGFFSSPAQAGSVAPHGSDAQVIQVEPGDSLWSVAARAGLERNAGDVVTDIVSLNALSSSVLIPGQSLLVPSK